MKSVSLLAVLQQGRLEAGCDEAGRGCLAGPVVAAAVIWPEDLDLPTLNDSKQLTHDQREGLRAVIEERAIAWAIGQAEPEEIDRINILHASFLAMERAISALRLAPEHLLIDGNRFRSHLDIPYTCIVKGDATYRSIAAASILAKTERDRLMVRMGTQYPHYDWQQNKGYPTAAHRRAIAAHGPSPLHRQSFRWSPPPGQIPLL